MSHKQQDFASKIREQGYRLTPQRELILDALCEFDRHATIGEIVEQVNQKNPKIDRATIYRAINFFRDLQLVNSAELGNQTVYEIAEDHTHHHLECRVCGSVQALDDHHFDALAHHLQTEHGFQAEIAHLTLKGICSNCQADPLQPHSHDNNEAVPSNDASIRLVFPNGGETLLSVTQLKSYPQTTLPTYTFHTDHGAHGPYRLTGVSLKTLLAQEITTPWSQVEVLSADGFGNRIFATELEDDAILLCYEQNGTPLLRRNGLVRLVVPSETDNALRQVKWVATIRVLQ